ncbi:pyruvate, phosphate dikinase [Alphaproteobacteria bacterium GH1-50]|uniref:Pyruvate, phosphate dikinase n=1 Tax=Kangsaoukella pontilimi TaxID=2691042 RepID=A0A7C9MDY6_9RHOB|nr:pyruvate, phosphate dikinase [Kangsaoukella pontilimi]MXQ06696.1 pyruvate, phosphate dikinase [Kangsaoukella pontilimi]
MQKHIEIADFIVLDPVAPVAVATHGGRAKCLQRLIRLEMPVPKTAALSFATVRAIAAGERIDTDALMAHFGPAPLVSVRPSSEDPDWGGPGAILNIGMNEARHAEFANLLGYEAADRLFARFIQTYAVQVARLDPDMFEANGDVTEESVSAMLDAYEEETDEPFPQDPARQLADVLRAMARAWEGTSARLLRQARGAPADAGLGLVVQAMAPGFGPAESGSGVIQFASPETGLPQVTGRYKSQSQGREALDPEAQAAYLTRDPRGISLEELCPAAFADLIRFGGICRTRLREEMQIEFTLDGGRLSVLDAVRIPRSSRAALRIAVALAEDGVITPEEAVLRIEPRSLNELLHRQIDPAAPRTMLADGIAASPGAATGKLVFDSATAQSYAARGEPCILVRRETSPGDIRGMHASVGVLTERGGMTSHAAVIARGLGLPCVVSARDIVIDRKDRAIQFKDGLRLGEGDTVTLDGTSGQLLMGAPHLLEPALDDAFRTLLGWADAARDIGVRANADTPAEAEVARAFEAEGIGLCRTEHMFFEADRLTVMREMIFANTAEDRAASLERLIPMQVKDFTELFRIMEGKPVCIRLFDPPLHEFLPSNREGMRELADALQLPLAAVTRRVEALAEFNPMLGMRGVRLGVTMPEIYEAQARAIFLATIAASRKGREPIVPEIMIPLVSARREVELVKMRVDAIAAAVRTEMGAEFDYRLGVMVETPRAALRAQDIAQHAAFLSFGTNDLTQMTYGLSRDDAGRFMNAYVQQGVYPEDPFHRLDFEGVGELLRIGAERGRACRSDIILSLCGEHGGDAESIAFCRAAGFDYVSCSPFRVPVARLAAAHLALSEGQ